MTIGDHRGRFPALLAIVGLAAALRFTGLSWGLRHPPHADEQVYVGNVAAMIEAGDFDHRYYSYPGLFYYLLAPGVAALGPQGWWSNDAYLVSRSLVAVCGVVNVVIAYLVGARLLGHAAGLAAALMLSVSPVDVRTSHQVRPDVLLEGFGLLGLLVFRRLGRDLREDLRSGLLIGAATAIKFTGLLAVPFYLGRRLLTPGRRIRGMVVAAALTAVVVAASTPYAVIHPARYTRGPLTELRLHYDRSPSETERSFLGNIRFFLFEANRAVGPMGILLFLGGSYACLRSDPRFWGPALIHPVTTLLVMSTATLTFPRFILPAMGIVCVVAGAAVEVVATRSRIAAVVLASLTVLSPLANSARYVNLIRYPSPADRALDWIESNGPTDGRVLETRVDAHPSRDPGSLIGVDPARFETLFLPEAENAAGVARLAPEADLVVTGPAPGDWAQGFSTVFEARLWRPSRDWLHLGPPRRDGPVVLQLRVPARRPAYREADLATARITASENQDALPALRDGDLATSWRTRYPLRGSEWIDVRFPSPLSLGRVETVIGEAPRGFGPALRLMVSEDGDSYRLVRTVDARPSLSEQGLLRRKGAVRPFSQLLAFDPVTVRGLRIEQVGVRDEPWVVAELRVDILLSPIGRERDRTAPEKAR